MLSPELGAPKYATDQQTPKDQSTVVDTRNILDVIMMGTIKQPYAVPPVKLPKTELASCLADLLSCSSSSSAAVFFSSSTSHTNTSVLPY